MLGSSSKKQKPPKGKGGVPATEDGGVTIHRSYRWRTDPEVFVEGFVEFL